MAKFHANHRHKEKAKVIPPCGPTCAGCVMGGLSVTTLTPPGSGFFYPDGLMTSGVMIVAEALGEADAVQFKALVGPGGFLMGRAFSRMGWGRDMFRYCQVLSCHPTDDVIRDGRNNLLGWAESAIRTCAPNLDQEIATWKPKCILAFGPTAFTRLTGITLPIMSARGYVFWSEQYQTWVVPTFHPTFIQRGMNALTTVFLWDVQKALKVARDGYQYDNVECLTDPSLKVWDNYVKDFCHDPTRPLAFDIETPYKRRFSDDEDNAEGADDLDPTYQINCVSFAFEHDRGASVTWGMPYLRGIEQMLQASMQYGSAEAWNLAHDRPRVMNALKLDMPRERCVDTMDKWHVIYNSLPRKLGFATSCLPSSYGIKCWKHLAQSQPAYYSTIDSVALWRNGRDCDSILKATGADTTYDLFCRRLDPILEHMTRKGMGINGEKRDRLRTSLIAKMETLTHTMDAIVPEAVKSPKVWKSRENALKGRETLVERLRREGDPHAQLIADAELFEIAATQEAMTCGVCGKWPVSKSNHTNKKTITAPVEVVND